MKGVFDPRMVLADPRMVVEEVATLVTAITAALAAFQSTVPGASRRWFWVPVATLAVWLAAVGAGCVDDYVRLGMEGLTVRFDGGCMVPAVLIGVVPTVAIVVMLRRGAPLVPRLTLALAGLAVAALANFGLSPVPRRRRVDHGAHLALRLRGGLVGARRLARADAARLAALSNSRKSVKHFSVRNGVRTKG